MEILIWITVGLAAGLVARWIMPGPSAGGLAFAIPLGIAGALIGGGLSALLVPATGVSFDVRGILMATAASFGLLLAYRSYALRLPV
jgi:uncharacterized membrane protein YeaQ/YmgE (transglycosylase-associated protein family)